MRIRILGGGWYGCHIARALLADGHDVEVHEIRDRIFTGASGSIPARLHLGFHYPRSRMTRAACLEHHREFMAEYGDLTRGVPVNLYAIAKDSSYIDFAQYRATLRDEVEFVTVHDPAEYGLENVEGALLTGERHILVDRARSFFEQALGDTIKYGVKADDADPADYDMTIDCTFCSNSNSGVDRYEPCLVPLLRGPTNVAVTIMDGPFSSLYPWDEEAGLSSLSSALFTPFSKSLKTYQEAKVMLDRMSPEDMRARADQMLDQMASFYPAARDYEIVGLRHSIRAMPLSGADTRLVDVARLGDRMLGIRAGKIDAVIHAERMVKEMLPCG